MQLVYWPYQGVSGGQQMCCFQSSVRALAKKLKTCLLL